MLRGFLVVVFMTLFLFFVGLGSSGATENLVVSPDGMAENALWTWGYYKYNTTSEREELRDFAVQFGYTTVLVEVNMWIGYHVVEGERWSDSHVAGLQELVYLLRKEGITVYAMGGAACWPIDQQTMYQDEMVRIRSYNSRSEELEQLQGYVFDVEWHDCATENDPDVMLPLYLNMAKDVRRYLNLPVGGWAWYWQVSTGRDTVSYQGVNTWEGHHMLEHLDMVFAGTFCDGPICQESLLEPWVVAANASFNRARLYGMSLTNDDSTDWMTWWEEGTEAMLDSHEYLAGEFGDEEGTAYTGMCVHYHGDLCRMYEDEEEFDCSFY